MARVTIVGLGPAGPDLITAGTLAAIAAHQHCFLRTSRHPGASVVADAVSFDDLYESATSFDQVYSEIVERLVAAAMQHGEVLYAVPGSPAVAERTVELLRIDHRVSVDVLAALSFVDLTWTRLGIDPLTERPRIIDGHRFATDCAGDHGPFLVTQVHSSEVLSEIKLAFDDQSPERVTVLSRLGLDDELIIEIPWNELDRVAADHLTSLWIPRSGVAIGEAFVSIENVMKTLRARCPWDRVQTHASLAKYVHEEAAELVEAIADLNRQDGPLENDGPTDDAIDHLADELGDVLFQVVFHACLAAENGWFSLSEVVAGLESKLVRRHPHVFTPPGSVPQDWVADTPEAVRGNWQRIKAAEKSAPKPFLSANVYSMKLIE